MQKSSLPYSTTIYSVQLQLYIQNLLNFDSVACLPLLSFSARWKGGKERKGFSVVSSRVNVLRGNEKRGIKGGGREKGREQFWKRRWEKERGGRNSLWSTSDWRFCITRLSFNCWPSRLFLFFFSSRCEACRVARRATGSILLDPETR